MKTKAEIRDKPSLIDFFFTLPNVRQMFSINILTSKVKKTTPQPPEPYDVKILPTYL